MDSGLQDTKASRLVVAVELYQCDLAGTTEIVSVAAVVVEVVDG